MSKVDRIIGNVAENLQFWIKPKVELQPST